VDEKKIAAIGLRVRRGCTFHGLSLNVDMDLEPFSRINPCGYPGLKTTQLAELGGPTDLQQVVTDLSHHLARQLDYTLAP
jgi:lipoyl(octanoyl) transferase